MNQPMSPETLVRCPSSGLLLNRDGAAAHRTRRRSARSREEQVRAFQAHAAVAAGTLLVILAVNLLTNLSAGIAGDVSAWWSLWAVVGWMPGLGVHGLVVWLARPTHSEGAGS